MESDKAENDWRKKPESRNNSRKYPVQHSNVKTTQNNLSKRYFTVNQKSEDAKSLKQTPLKSAITEHSSNQQKSGKYKPTSLYQQQYIRIASAKNSQTFSVMSYNILADCNITKQYFPYCRRYELDWKARAPKILKRIHRFSADVLCLQEVEGFSQLESELSKQNYAGIYKQRTGPNEDGCAIFYDKNKFQLLDHTLLEYNQSNHIEWLDRDNVAIVCMFKYLGKSTSNNNDNQKEIEKLVCVANTHLLFNPKRGDIKFAQLQMLFMTIKTMMNQYAELNPALVVCGGTNAPFLVDICRFEPYTLFISVSMHPKRLMQFTIDGPEDSFWTALNQA